MNIYNFLVSQDIAAHCEEIGHIFNPLEMAIIVALSEKTMKEKHMAWREIVSEYPDMPIHGSLNFKARDSLHDYLYDFISREEITLESFLQSDSHNDYRFTAVGYDNGHKESESVIFINTYFEEARAKFEKYQHVLDNEILSYIVVEKMIDEDHTAKIYINRSGEIEEIGGSIFGGPDRLEDIFFHLPVPFEKGDLVELCDGTPGVLQDIPHWWNTERLSYADFISGKRGDGTDMCAYGYFINNEGWLMIDAYPCALSSLRYFKGELLGQERFLKYLSQFKKNKDENLDWLINVFCKFKAEVEQEKINGLFGEWYYSL